MRALLRASENVVRTFLSDSEGRLAGIQPDPGKPPPMFGQWYYALHAGDIRGDLETNGLSNDKLFGIQVTITARKAYAPRDRKGQVFVTEDDVFERAEAVADLLHMSYDVMNAANALIVGTADYAGVHGGDVTTNGFCEPLRFQSISPPVEAPPEWYGGKNETPEVFVSTVTLGEARRLRYL